MFLDMSVDLAARILKVSSDGSQLLRVMWRNPMQSGLVMLKYRLLLLCLLSFYPVVVSGVRLSTI